jgi:hypothetical protein
LQRFVDLRRGEPPSDLDTGAVQDVTHGLPVDLETLGEVVHRLADW